MLEANLCADKIVKDFSKQRPIRAGSFIITLYGDAMLSRPSGIWTGHIIDICGQVGINESLVRTAISRLMADNRLEGTKVGRKSYYSLTKSSQQEFQHVVKRLYSGRREDGSRWTFVLNLNASHREELKRQLEGLGFGAPTHGLFMKPGDCMVELDFAFGSSLTRNGNMVFGANLEDVLAEDHITNLLSTAWDLRQIEKQYQLFHKKFDTVFDSLNKGGKLSDLNCFILREILVHEYRKIALKDPWLPLAMLPKDWPGLKGFLMFTNLYKMIYAQSETYLNHLLEDNYK